MTSNACSHIQQMAFLKSKCGPLQGFSPTQVCLWLTPQSGLEQGPPDSESQRPIDRAALA